MRKNIERDESITQKNCNVDAKKLNHAIKCNRFETESGFSCFF